jgi:uncharacterized protein
MKKLMPRSIKNERKRVILDTNTLISGLLKPDSIPNRAIRKAFDECDVFVSEETLEELQDVLFRKKLDRYFTLRETIRGRFLAFYRMKALTAEITEHIAECKDKKDNKFLSLAVAANAHVLISGDEKHLLSMSPFRGIRIIKAADFMNE